VSDDRWAVMLVPFSLIRRTDEVTGECRITGEVHMRRAVEVLYANAAERTTFYQSLLEISWLPPALRRAVMAKLGLSLRKQKRDIEYARTVTMRHMIEERKQAMRAQRLRPRGGIHEAAVEEIAAALGMTVPTLKKRLQRLKQRQKN
jgi:ribosome-associated translation inhibitor RaiA